ncbi:MAG TPA: TldD/PmbA family protein [Gemmatimonadales bacterium]|nr:TldD/PmbA family protein [Gemmatimonadales bacterium]
MSMDRREFVKTTAATVAAAAFVPPTALEPAAPTADPAFKEIAMAALNAGRAAGASYVDVRIAHYRSQFIRTRERQIAGVTDTESLGVGVRTLVQGTWGFAASRALTKDAAARAAREAAAISKANRAARLKPVELAPVAKFPNASWRSPHKVDPWSVPIETKVGVLLAANEAALKVDKVKYVFSGLFFVKEEKTFASTEGSFITQTIIRTWAPMQITAVASDFSDFQRRANTTPPTGRGYEVVEQSLSPESAARWAEQAAQRLSAKPVEPGRYTLVLHPSHLWLTIHESIGHPTELDRALGYEANYAGTSFLAPPEQVIGKFQYGPEFMNVQGDRTQEGSCGQTGWDDEGVQAEAFPIVKNGVFVDYQTTREQVAWIAGLGGAARSHGCSYADSWSSIQFQRMPNVSLLPGSEERSAEDLIAATDRGIYVVGDGSYSIDQQRYNFQFGGQVCYEIAGGKLMGLLKDVAYQSRTADFWNAMDMIGGPRSYELHGSFFDGKGQPGQINAVSHGCPPARFRDVTVINTGRKS